MVTSLNHGTRLKAESLIENKVDYLVEITRTQIFVDGHEIL